MLNATIRPATKQERAYAYAQTQEIEMKTCYIGYLRGDFGRNGSEFWSNWFDGICREKRNTSEFKADIDVLINTMRGPTARGNVFYGLLSGRSQMVGFCAAYPEAKFHGNYTEEYCFRIDTEMYTYILRCQPHPGDYNFYLFCYERKWLQKHLDKAANGIRILDVNGKMLYKLKDRERVCVIGSAGKRVDDKTYTVYYIDDSHLELGQFVRCTNIYHTMELAERLNRSNCRLVSAETW